jgi:hypothetical protein
VPRALLLCSLHGASCTERARARRFAQRASMYHSNACRSAGKQGTYVCRTREQVDIFAPYVANASQDTPELESARKR